MHDKASVPTLEAQDLAALLDLERRARHSGSAQELAFLLVNDTHQLTPYRQAVLWSSTRGVLALSGLLQAEANAPYVQWLQRLLRGVISNDGIVFQRLDADTAPDPVAQEWADWWPAEAVLMELPAKLAKGEAAEERLLLALARDTVWTDKDAALLREWLDAAGCQLRLRGQQRSWRNWVHGLRKVFWAQNSGPWWKGVRWLWLAVVGGILAMPVSLSVLAPGELVPANPTIVRAPLDGVVDVFYVKPNQDVQKDAPLFGFDEALIQSRLEVSRQALATAEVEYRQTSQQALSDPRARSQMAALVGKIEEKRAELNYLRDQRKRSQVLAPQSGVVLLDDPLEWIGRPVTVGERVLRIAAPHAVEVEAWLPIADAIALPVGSRVLLYLNAEPSAPMEASLRTMGHSAIQRPDGTFAYRVRATLQQPTDKRVGLKGTAKLVGGEVSVMYWLIRKPLAAARAYLGV